ncbi:hypothetical protein [Methyloversatilis thermotolerans]|uniref:hypothetical protein n=1 Tax=Methyloversatilis thermotolerans TaxID=1346290 RepID=UPI00036AC03A|nr:hypothetical protein [Methyloversatilis thermotolerans]
MRIHVRVLYLFLLHAATAFADAPPALQLEPRFSVSGLSSGAAMAVQIGVAHSSRVSGIGIVAGPPYLCAQGFVTTAVNDCLLLGRSWWQKVFGGWFSPLSESGEKNINVNDLIADTRELADAGRIDPLQGLSGMRVWEYRGESDTVVGSKASWAQRAWFEKLGAEFHREAPRATPHTMPTADSDLGGCDVNAPGYRPDPDYVSSCGFDAAGTLLRWLRKRDQAQPEAPRGRWYALDQGQYIPDLGRVTDPAQKRRMTGLEAQARVFVPDVCRQETCQVHVALHGCVQGEKRKDYDTWVERSGYTRWAGPLRLVLLFPRVTAIKPGEAGAWSNVSNPMGCWDWWGYSTPQPYYRMLDYATRQAPQIRTITNMVDALGAQP